MERTLHQLPSVHLQQWQTLLLATRRASNIISLCREVVTHLASFQFDSDNMTQRLMEELDGNTKVGHFDREFASFCCRDSKVEMSLVTSCGSLSRRRGGCVDICVK